MSRTAPSTEANGHREAAVASSTPAAAVASRGTASVAAGDDDRIPRIFLGGADLVVLTLAFFAAHYFAPRVQRSLLPGGILSGFLPAIFQLPDTPSPLFPPLAEVSWLLVAAAPATLVVMELAGGYTRLLHQSALRLTTSAILSQAIAISFSSLIVFALKLSSSSRVLIFTYGLLSAFGLLAYRAGMWTYQRRRQARGVYAKNVLAACG